MISLTPLQSEAKRYLVKHIEKYGFAPTVQDVADHLGIKAKSGGHRLLTMLEKRGHIRRIPYCPRAIEILE